MIEKKYGDDNEIVGEPQFAGFKYGRSRRITNYTAKLFNEYLFVM